MHHYLQELGFPVSDVTFFLPWRDHWSLADDLKRQQCVATCTHHRSTLRCAHCLCPISLPAELRWEKVMSSSPQQNNSSTLAKAYHKPIQSVTLREPCGGPAVFAHNTHSLVHWVSCLLATTGGSSLDPGGGRHFTQEPGFPCLPCLATLVTPPLWLITLLRPQAPTTHWDALFLEVGCITLVVFARFLSQQPWMWEGAR
jgi:hypothetical protein